jgi:hypothetical protein
MEHMPLNHRKRWTKKEIKDLIKETQSKIDITKIAENHKRTISAIKFKLIRYAVDLIEEEPSTSLKHIQNLTNLSKEDLLEGFKKIKYNYKDENNDENDKIVYENIYLSLLIKINLFWIIYIFTTYIIQLL